MVLRLVGFRINFEAAIIKIENQQTNQIKLEAPITITTKK